MNKKENKTEQPLVAIVCLVYNQDAFLRDCFEGFVMQQTDFSFVAIVHDDASTDNSAEIIHEYEAKYPHIFKPIYQTENQYSKPRVSVMRIAMAIARETGVKYIAMCEGDDYWTDPLKLQRQVDFLETHPKYTLSTENAIRHYLGSQKKELFSELPTRDVCIEDLIQTRQFATASVLFRADALSIPKGIKTYDTMIWCLLSQQGKIHYNNIVSSIYRVGEGVTKKDKIKWAYQIAELNQSLFSVIKIDKKIKNIHDKELLAMILSGIRKAFEEKKYSDVYKLFIHTLHIGFVPWMLLIKQIIHYKVFKLK